MKFLPLTLDPPRVRNPLPLATAPLVRTLPTLNWTRFIITVSSRSHQQAEDVLRIEEICFIHVITGIYIYIFTVKCPLIQGHYH